MLSLDVKSLVYYCQCVPLSRGGMFRAGRLSSAVYTTNINYENKNITINAFSSKADRSCQYLVRILACIRCGPDDARYFKQLWMVRVGIWTCGCLVLADIPCDSFVLSVCVCRDFRFVNQG